ncbi:FAD binding domain-containing protein [Nonomuraea turcica]|uniref:FAD binding domain-containing protein n=1 Tax=Nonomuraea sp. G32 TaxID=3067274 RepID=UPI00273B8735|nr:xanthine dehydrogenase family protein subunit M [Nonomuraea sp. G32]MDP4504190.1 xanthine dehydrogenase family protein subunit M [Nonomuraea sp. G32]
MDPFQYVRPRSLDEAIRVLAGNPTATVIAGGTDLTTLMRDGIRRPSHLIDINGLDLAEVSERPDGGLRIGALCRNAVSDKRIERDFPVLTEALRSGASPQIRNRATFGGNLLQRVRCPYYRVPEFACNRRDPGSGCAALDGDSSRQAILGTSRACVAVHPSDCAVALQALDAEILVRGPGGERRIPIDALHRLPGDTPAEEVTLRRDELVLAVELPPRAFSERSHYVKFRDRASYAFALTAAAVAVELRGGRIRSSRIALGGVAPKPWRARAAERALYGRPFDKDAIDAAAKAATDGAAPRPDNTYKVNLAQEVVRRALTELKGDR